MNIDLYYLSGNTTGGWVTYTAHLMYGFQRIPGVNVSLFKIGNNTENKPRNFGYSIEYRNLSIGDAVARKNPAVIVALQKNYRDKATVLIDNGAWMVVHDPAEFANLKLSETSRYVTIRKAVAAQVPGSTFIPHPYLRHYPNGTMATGKVRACSICRIDFDKHTDILLDANRVLSQCRTPHRIQIHGFENRLYTRFKICPKYPEWEQSKAAYPRDKTTATEICNDATFTVDMSLIKGDGGGTQYSFMEAMDAGSVNVIHKEWVMPNDEMKPYPHPEYNCLCASDGNDLASTLLETYTQEELRRVVLRGNILLTRHEPVKIAKQFVSLLSQ